MLTHGTGFVLFTDLYSKKDLDQAHKILIDQVKKNDAVDAKQVAGQTGHDNIYANSKKGKVSTQGKRVWNLLSKGQCFETIVQETKVMSVIDKVLGNDFCLGSYAANHLQRGAGHQNPHLDYPYWDYKDRKSWVQSPKYDETHHFHMNVQTLIMMDDFTLENGATACVPFSQ